MTELARLGSSGKLLMKVEVPRLKRVDSESMKVAISSTIPKAQPSLFSAA